MTDRIGPFDTANFTQDQWYRSAKLWVPSGVFGPPASLPSSGGLAMTTSGLAVTIGTGTALSRGALFDRDAAATVPGGTLNGNASLSRRDRIVLRRDLTAKTCAPTWLTGAPSASPTAPALTQVDTGVWDTPLFSFLVPPNNGSTITGIVDERLFVGPAAGVLMVYTMANRPATDIATTGMRIAALDDPARVYVYDGTRWVQEGVTIAAAVATAPLGSYVRRVRDSAVVTVSNTGGGFQITLLSPFSAAPVTGAALTPGTNVGGLAVVAAVSGQTTASMIGGVAYDHSGAAIASGTQIRVQYDVVGYNT